MGCDQPSLTLFHAVKRHIGVNVRSLFISEAAWQNPEQPITFSVSPPMIVSFHFLFKYCNLLVNDVAFLVAAERQKRSTSLEPFQHSFDHDNWESSSPWTALCGDP